MSATADKKDTVESPEEGSCYSTFLIGAHAQGDWTVTSVYEKALVKAVISKLGDRTVRVFITVNTIMQGGGKSEIHPKMEGSSSKYDLSQCKSHDVRLYFGDENSMPDDESHLIHFKTVFASILDLTGELYFVEFPDWRRLLVRDTEFHRLFKERYGF